MKKTRYIIIDDDLTSTTLTKQSINNSFEKALISTYENAEVALNFLTTEFVNDISHRAIILLDLDMPEMNGWNFLEHYDQMSDTIKSRIKIIIVSGYDNVENRKRAYQNRYVSEFIVKTDLYKNLYFRLSKHLSAA